MRDIVFPGGNEKEFLEVAEELGYDSLVFLYPAERLPEKKGKYKAKIAVLADPQEADKVRNKADLLFVSSSDQDRQVAEKIHPDVLFGVEEFPGYDALHHRSSGLNQIIAKAMAEKKVALGFSFDTLLTASPQERTVLMGRMRQNIGFCRKFGVRMVVGSFADSPEKMRNPDDLKALFVELGMHPSEAKKGLL